jgi:hypothetical protein
VSEPVTQGASESSGPAGYTDRRVVLVASAGVELSLADVVTNLATVCAEIGQRVAVVSTAGLASPVEDSELPQSTPRWWRHRPDPESGAGLPVEEDRDRLLNGALSPTDVEHLLGETEVPGVSRLDLRNFVGHPAQVVIRVPEVLAALRPIVDVVFLEVPSYLSVHYGEGLTPLADVVMVVGERKTTTLDQMRRMNAALRHLQAPVVGMALTDGGVEVYDWVRVEAELATADEQPSVERDPTERLLITRSAAIVPAPPFDELSVVQYAPREA